MLLARRGTALCLVVALGAALTACQDGEGRAAPATRSDTAATSTAASHSASSASPTPASPTPASPTPAQPPAGWPSGLPVPTVGLTDAAALKAYVDSLTPEQRRLFGAAVREGMSPAERAQLGQLSDRLKSLSPGALEQCTALLPVAATAAAVGLGASDDSAAQVSARRAFAASLDRLRTDTHPSPRVEGDLRVMAAALRRHASSGRALAASRDYVQALDDVGRFVDETCGER